MRRESTTSSPASSAPRPPLLAAPSWPTSPPSMSGYPLPSKSTPPSPTSGSPPPAHPLPPPAFRDEDFPDRDQQLPYSQPTPRYPLPSKSTPPSPTSGSPSPAHPPPPRTSRVEDFPDLDQIRTAILQLPFLNAASRRHTLHNACSRDCNSLSSLADPASPTVGEL